MPSRAATIALVLSASHGTIATCATGELWIYEALGPDSPQMEQIQVWPASVRWLDAQGRPLWHYAHASGTLTLIDHEARAYRRLDGDGVDALRAELAAALASQHQRIDALPAPDRATAWRQLSQATGLHRPWAAVEAANRWPPLGGNDRVAGLACRRLAVANGDRTVGEICVMDASERAGGGAILQMLSAMLQLADQMRSLAPDATWPAWPSHPLVAAARSGGLPLRIVEAVAGERRNELRLAQVQPLRQDAPSEDPVIPAGYRPLAGGR
jgi:hypothetical protein